MSCTWCRYCRRPRAYPGSRFTKEFDLTVGWLAGCLPRSAVLEYMRIDWKTVGRCVHRTLNEIKPERSRRLDNLVNIGIDETNYKKGHKYITVIVNHDTNSVVWAARGYGETVLEKFYKQLTPEQLSSIKVVTGDGARWITNCVSQFTPECERCLDSFHVIEWAMEALGRGMARVLARNLQRGRISVKIDTAKANAEGIKNSAYVLGKVPEHLTEQQQTKIEMIAQTYKRLYRAYRMKESLQLLLKIPDPEKS